MTSDALILVGRQTTHARTVFETHAERLERCDVVDDVHAVTYDSEPIRELRDQFADVDADQVYVVPMCPAHDYDTIDAVPAALSYLDGSVTYCEPIGRSPAVTDVLVQRARAYEAAGDDVSLVLVGFGSSSKPYHRQMADYHAARIDAEYEYGDVLTCYLLQNPTVECVRYNVSTDRAVAVPLFVARNEATEDQIPAKLDVDRDGIEYADPLGTHPQLTEAIHAAVARQRVVATDDEATPTGFEAQLTRNRRPVATDGEGPAR